MYFIIMMIAIVSGVVRLLKILKLTSQRDYTFIDLYK